MPRITLGIISYVPTPRLENCCAVLGTVSHGMDILRTLTSKEKASGRESIDVDLIQRIDIVEG